MTFTFFLRCIRTFPRLFIYLFFYSSWEPSRLQELESLKKNFFFFPWGGGGAVVALGVLGFFFFF